MTKTHIFCDDNGSSWIVKSLVVVAVDQADFPHGHNGWFLIIIYLEEVCDVGVARSNPSPIKLGLVPVMEDEWRRVDEEEIRNSFVERKKNCIRKRVDYPSFLL